MRKLTEDDLVNDLIAMVYKYSADGVSAVAITRTMWSMLAQIYVNNKRSGIDFLTDAARVYGVGADVLRKAQDRTATQKRNEKAVN